MRTRNFSPGVVFVLLIALFVVTALVIQTLTVPAVPEQDVSVAALTPKAAVAVPVRSDPCPDGYVFTTNRCRKYIITEDIASRRYSDSYYPVRIFQMNNSIYVLESNSIYLDGNIYFEHAIAKLPLGQETTTSLPVGNGKRFLTDSTNNSRPILIDELNNTIYLTSFTDTTFTQLEVHKVTITTGAVQSFAKINVGAPTGYDQAQNHARSFNLVKDYRGGIYIVSSIVRGAQGAALPANSLYGTVKRLTNGRVGETVINFQDLINAQNAIYAFQFTFTPFDSAALFYSAPDATPYVRGYLPTKTTVDVQLSAVALGKPEEREDLLLRPIIGKNNQIGAIVSGWGYIYNRRAFLLNPNNASTKEFDLSAYFNGVGGLAQLNPGPLDSVYFIIGFEAGVTLPLSRLANTGEVREFFARNRDIFLAFVDAADNIVFRDSEVAGGDFKLGKITFTNEYVDLPNTDNIADLTVTSTRLVPQTSATNPTQWIVNVRNAGPGVSKAIKVTTNFSVDVSIRPSSSGQATCSQSTARQIVCIFSADLAAASTATAGMGFVTNSATNSITITSELTQDASITDPNLTNNKVTVTGNPRQ